MYHAESSFDLAFQVVYQVYFKINKHASPDALPRVWELLLNDSTTISSHAKDAQLDSLFSILKNLICYRDGFKAGSFESLDIALSQITTNMIQHGKNFIHSQSPCFPILPFLNSFILFTNLVWFTSKI